MATPKTLAVIGASEETVAHLRLLMKLGGRQLQHEWHWGEADKADFVAVEVHDLGCAGVLARCQAAGVPCAVMAEANEVVVHGLVLRRPFKLDQIVAVLNAAGAASAEAGPVEAFADDFYTRDLDDAQIPVGRTNPDDVWTKHERPQATIHLSGTAAAADLDMLIHGDPLVEPEAPKPLIDANTTIAPGAHEPTRRSEGRADQSRHRVPAGVVGVAPVDVAPIVLPPRNEANSPLPATPARLEAGDTAGYRFSDYFDGDLVPSPSQLQAPDLPAIVLDPKAKAFHTEADLSLLAPYASTSLPRSLLKVVSTTELARARDAHPARGYDELRWLLALLKGGGRLASRLDPGGSFQVAEPVRIDPAFHSHGRIAAALARPARLHEIAAASNASMEQVFDVVSAYDAIGRLKWTPRQRLASSDPAPDPKSGGALSRLWPFGKR
jgi:hypothetical protein